MTRRLFFFSVVFFLLSEVQAYSLDRAREKISKYAPDGVVVLNDQQGNRIFSHNSSDQLIPASIIKILTSLVALDTLGKDFRFSTKVFVHQSQDLLIQGQGDPFFTSEEIASVAKAVKEKFGRKQLRLRSLFIDPYSFMDPLLVSGVKNSIEPYDAINAGLIVNFNTINVKRALNREVLTGESETPLTPIAKKKGRLVRPGQTRRLNLGSNFNLSFRYSWELINAIFKEQGIVFTDQEKYIEEFRKDYWTHVLDYKNSHNLEFLVLSLLRYSNNFIANQVFLTVGKKEGRKANLEDSVQFFLRYIDQKLNIDIGEFYLDEGSGISRKNTISGNAMIKIVEAFSKYEDLLPWHYKTRLKSGTLTGAYNYAGFIPTKKGSYPFVIMMNQKRNRRFKVLKELRRLAFQVAKTKN